MLKRPLFYCGDALRMITIQSDTFTCASCVYLNQLEARAQTRLGNSHESWETQIRFSLKICWFHPRRRAFASIKNLFFYFLIKSNGTKWEQSEIRAQIKIRFSLLCVLKIDKAIECNAWFCRNRDDVNGSRSVLVWSVWEKQKFKWFMDGFSLRETPNVQ